MIRLPENAARGASQYYGMKVQNLHCPHLSCGLCSCRPCLKDPLLYSASEPELQEAGIAARHVQSPRSLMRLSDAVCPPAGLAIDGNELYSASEDGSVRAWDLRSLMMSRR